MSYLMRTDGYALLAVILYGTVSGCAGTVSSLLLLEPCGTHKILSNCLSIYSSGSNSPLAAQVHQLTAL